MKAVILSAGQGKRLLPLTANNPKCLVKIDGQSLVEWQIDELIRCGVDRVSCRQGQTGSAPALQFATDQNCL